MQRDEEGAESDAAVMSQLRQILTQVEQSDFERIDPPAGLWEQIAAAAGFSPARSPLEPPSREFTPSPVVEYWIDADDVVIEVGPTWADLAREGDAPELALPAPDRTLWTYFESDEIREVWRLLVERVRWLQRGVEVPLRCDAPAARRWLDMTITPEPDGRVHFRCVLAFEEARPPVALLDIQSERDYDLEPVPLCSWCGRAQYDSRWVDIEEVVRAGRLLEQKSMPPISHGICGSCRDEMSAELLVPGAVGESTT